MRSRTPSGSGGWTSGRRNGVPVRPESTTAGTTGVRETVAATGAGTSAPEATIASGTPCDIVLSSQVPPLHGGVFAEMRWLSDWQAGWNRWGWGAWQTLTALPPAVPHDGITQPGAAVMMSTAASRTGAKTPNVPVPNFTGKLPPVERTS